MKFPLLVLAFVSAVACSFADAKFPERPALPAIPDREFKLTDFGAVGDSHTLNTAAFTRAIAAVDAAGGGRLIVPAGVFVTGPFRLCSRLDLHLAAEAVIQAPATFAELGLPDPAQFQTQADADRVYRLPDPLVSGRDLHDVVLSGSGAIDGNGRHWWEWSERAARNAAKAGHPGRITFRRPHLIVLENCQRVRVTGVTLRNSSMFHLVARGLDDLTVDHVTVRAPWDGSAPNTDAIDPGPGRRFWIHHCDIDTGDDDIVIKSGGTDVLIEDNTIGHGHGISVGSPTADGIDGMLVRNCSFDGTDSALRIKSMRGAGGLVQNIRYENITMRNVEHAFVLQLDYVDNNRPNFRGDPAKIPAIRHVTFENIIVHNARNAGLLHGIPESPIRDVLFRNVQLTAETDFDRRHADGVTFENVTRTIRPGVGPARIEGEH